MPTNSRGQRVTSHNQKVKDGTVKPKMKKKRKKKAK